MSAARLKSILQFGTPVFTARGRRWWIDESNSEAIDRYVGREYPSDWVTVREVHGEFISWPTAVMARSELTRESSANTGA